MSAYMVSDETINRIISYLQFSKDFDWELTKAGYDLKKLSDRKTLGARMFALNRRGVDSRYGRGQAKEFRALSYKYAIVITPTKVQAFKSLSCLLYQCMEGKVPEHAFYKFLTRLHDQIAVLIVQESEAYQKAKWG